MKKWIPVLPVSALLLTISMLYSCSGTAQQTQAATPVTPEAVQRDPAAAPQTGVQNINAATFKQLLRENPEAVVVDVRTPAEVAQDAIPGAVHIDISRPDFATKIAELDKSKTYLLYCRSGVRSANASKFMHAEGFQNVYNLLGGINAWNAQK